MVLLIDLFFPFIFDWAIFTFVGILIIYPSTVASVDVQLKNKDEFNYIVQTWFYNGDLHIVPEKASGIPFIYKPPVFRI
ncbi:fimbria/pilus periplasmic chaperone, partial [Klebsiella pneumoniae]